MRPAAAPLRPEDPASLGAYTLLGRLGEGGMGVVLLGRDRQDRYVAIKVIRSQHASEPQFITRFRREVAAAAQVPRFCTAAVLDADLDAEQPYLVTEFVDGLSLHAAVAQRGPLRGSELDALAVGVAAALTAIHDAGVIHRDLKPGNVLLSSAGPRVIDFGIARAADATTHTLTGQVLGTPGYMAPEQVAGERVTPAADVFAWGGVVAFAASGDPPFGRNLSVPAALHRILHADPELDLLEERLRPVVAAAMAKDPDERPSAQELLDRTLARADRAEVSRTQAAAVLEQATAPAPGPTTPALGGAAPGVAGSSGAQPADPDTAVAEGSERSGAAEAGAAPTPPVPRGRPVGIPPVVPGPVVPGAGPGPQATEPAAAGGGPAPAEAAGTAVNRAAVRTAVGPASVAARWSSGTTQVGAGGSKLVRRRRRARRTLLATTLAAVVAVAGAIWVDPFSALGGTPGQNQTTPTTALATTTTAATVPAATAAGEGVRLPDVRGQDINDAKLSLEGDGFTVITSQQVSAIEDAGLVLSSEPPQDSLVEPGATITLTVGLGPAQEPPAGWAATKRVGREVNNSPILSVDPNGNELQVGVGDSADAAPDGTVAYVALDDGFTGQLTTVRPDGSDARQITSESGSSVNYLAWSPDGQSIAYTLNTGGVFVIGADGGGRRQIADVTAFELDWAPDGKQIVYREGSGSQQLEVVSVDGSGPRRLTDLAGGAFEPAWSPDGQSILLSDGAGGIHMVGADGTGLSQILGPNAWHPSWTPDGDICYVRGDGSFNGLTAATGPVYIFPMDGIGGETQVGAITASDPVQWAGGS